MKYLLLFHGNNGYTNAVWCYIYTYISSLVNVKSEPQFFLLCSRFVTNLYFHLNNLRYYNTVLAYLALHLRMTHRLPCYWTGVSAIPQFQFFGGRPELRSPNFTAYATNFCFPFFFVYICYWIRIRNSTCLYYVLLLYTLNRDIDENTRLGKKI